MDKVVCYRLATQTSLPTVPVPHAWVGFCPVGPMRGTQLSRARARWHFETQHVLSRHQLDRAPDKNFRKKQDHPASKVDISNHETRCEPRSGERLHIEERGTLTHGESYEPIELVEYFTEHRVTVGSLQPKDDGHSDRELEQREMHDTSYQSE